MNEKAVNLKLSKMNYTLEDFIKVQKELLEYDIDILEKSLNNIEKEVYVKVESDDKKISYLNHELILINEQVDDMLYVESVKKAKTMEYINLHLKAIRMIDKKNYLNKLYDSLITQKRKKKIIELKKDIYNNYNENRKNIKIHYIIIVIIYITLGASYFLKLLNI
jgi:hypothetical protein